MNHFYFQIFTYRQTFKIFIIMSKKAIKVIFEVLKAIIYGLGGFFGGNALI